jgi:molecular chaperone GrpE
MTEKTHPTDAVENTEETLSPESLSTESIHQKFEELRQKLEAAQAKADENFNRAARAMADAENIRRNADRDIEKAHKFALESFVKALFPIMDTLERALEFEPTQASQADLSAQNPIQIMREGITLTLKMFVDTLARFGVEQVNPVDQLFNPEIHEAISMVSAPDKKPNHVLHVVQKGYLLNGRISRRARVVTVAN